MQKLIVFIILICIFSVNAFTKENEYFHTMHSFLVLFLVLGVCLID